METLTKTLFTNWHFMRWLRLGLGLFIAFQAIKNHDSLSGFFAAFLLFQAVTNTGCCGARGCSVPSSKTSSDEVQDIKFEEVK
ncbi:MAG: hypothetical protein Q8891_08850 [Bacteroidota bacterium]|nr:hypothetical protein [Bacteroidota bacterium]